MCRFVDCLSVNADQEGGSWLVTQGSPSDNLAPAGSLVTLSWSAGARRLHDASPKVTPDRPQDAILVLLYRGAASVVDHVAEGEDDPVAPDRPSESIPVKARGFHPDGTAQMRRL